MRKPSLCSNVAFITSVSSFPTSHTSSRLTSRSPNFVLSSTKSAFTSPRLARTSFAPSAPLPWAATRSAPTKDSQRQSRIPHALLLGLSAVSAVLYGSARQVVSTAAGLLLLGFIIVVHEAGHFLAARYQRIRVKSFSIGFGPKVAAYTPKGSETEFALRALPLGGYVGFPEQTTVDEVTGEEIVDKDPNLLQNRPILDRAIVISAGCIANIMLAWMAIFTSVSTVGLPHFDFHPGVVIASLVDGEGAGAKAGILSGDVILQIDHQDVADTMQSASNVAQTIRKSEGRPILFHIKRGEKELDIRVKPKCCSPNGDSAMGVQLVPNATVSRERPSGPNEALRLTNREFGNHARQTFSGLFSILTNFKEQSSHLAGPVGVVSMGAELAQNDTAALLTFCAVISLNLALINSLPLPALDGGQMLFLLVEALRGSPLSMKFQDAVNRTALLLFLAFSGVLFFGDLEKLNILSAIQRLFG